MTDNQAGFKTKYCWQYYNTPKAKGERVKLTMAEVNRLENEKLEHRLSDKVKIPGTNWSIPFGDLGSAELIVEKEKKECEDVGQVEQDLFKEHITNPVNVDLEHHRIYGNVLAGFCLITSCPLPKDSQTVHGLIGCLYNGYYEKHPSSIFYEWIGDVWRSIPKEWHVDIGFELKKYSKSINWEYNKQENKDGAMIILDKYIKSFDKENSLN